MNRRKKAFDNLFECYKREGRELGIMELKRLYPREVSYLRKVTLGSNLRVLLSRMKKIYADRWHEIYNKNLVHEKPIEASEPSPLDVLRMASRKKDE